MDVGGVQFFIKYCGDLVEMADTNNTNESNNNESKNIEKTELIKMYEKVIKSLKDERTQEFIKLYFGNNAINTTELNYILPIYYDI